MKRTKSQIHKKKELQKKRESGEKKIHSNMTKDRPYCMNCGNSAHCDGVLYRKEIEVVNNKVIHEWTIDVCKYCRCEECDKDED